MKSVPFTEETCPNWKQQYWKLMSDLQSTGRIHFRVKWQAEYTSGENPQIDVAVGQQSNKSLDFYI